MFGQIELFVGESGPYEFELLLTGMEPTDPNN